ncbi:traF-related protein [Vibrio ishigakensis]|uniref:TraF-related protein n=2 Tax=Vibrio ishigakensis TaxID=1481914 RepID=A0A0B8NUJ6_9VIBR|nr:conjugal transfer protein TraF [Vibrio ishigakensis]GAM57586.1 traF-related protein [Vibrio ishigakensis]
MNLVKQGIPLSAISLLLSTPTLADSRSVAMGGTGVASANFMSASFHNPALAAKGESEHNFGMILPTVTASVHDGEGVLDKLDTYFDAEDDWIDNPGSIEARNAWRRALQDLNNGDITADASAGMVFAIPNKFVNTNFFVSTHATMLATADIDDNDLDNTSPDDEVESTATGLIGGTLDYGFTFAKNIELWGQDMSFGASPKVQQIYTTYFRERLTEDDIDDADFFDDLESKTTFNIDLGASWQVQEHWNLAISARNLISHSLDTNMQLGERATFEVKPEYKIGTAYSTNWYTLAADIDLNSRSYFKQQSYKTQYARLGAEADLWKWAQLRAGYMHSMTSYSEDVFTAGIGFRPYGVFGFDISGQFGNDDNYGVSAQLTLVI